MTPMTTIPALSQTVQSSAVTSTATPSSSATLSADFDAFLQMLTAQARYQDPLEPVSSSDYAAQLAQFSMVEQQVFTNDQLTGLANVLGGNAMSTMANWVGMEARASASVAFDGAPVTIAPNPLATANQVELVVFDDTGSEVARRTLPVSADPYIWDGLDQSGVAVDPGVYSFSVESFSNGELALNEPAEVYARIAEAQIVGGDLVLMLDGGAYVLASQVTALRDPAI